MCVIFCLMPGVNPEWEKFENAVHNNPHGFGLILRDPKHNRLELIKSSEEELKTGTDPKKLFDLLKKNDDIERYLHIRWRTEGSISQDNVQPFCSYNSNSRQVYFMHNGTLYNYRTTGVSHYNQGQHVKADQGDSDTKKFNDTFLSPFLNRFKGEEGLADIKDKVGHEIIAKYWGNASHNRGLLISNDQGFILINKSGWETIKNSDGSEYLASNKTYFDTLSRGFKYEADKKAKEEKEALEKVARFQESNKNLAGLTQLKDVDFSSKIKLSDSVKDLMQDIDIYSQDGIASLKNLTAAELLTFIEKNENEVISLILHLTDEYAKLLEKYQSVTDYVKKLQDDRKAKVG